MSHKSDNDHLYSNFTQLEIAADKGMSLRTVNSIIADFHERLAFNVMTNTLIRRIYLGELFNEQD